MMTVAATVLLASVAGSLHCAGMCGPLLAIVQGGNAPRLHVAYQAGRLAAYALLGFAAGVVGHGIDTMASARGLENAGVALAGTALVITALARSFSARGHRPRTFAAMALTRALAREQPVLRALLFGAATGLMPCGWLYAWLSVAAAAGAPVSGALVMVSFGLGSVPALAAGNAIAAKVMAHLRFRAPRFAPLLLAAIGLVAVATRGPAIASVHRALEHASSAERANSVCHGG